MGKPLCEALLAVCVAACSTGLDLGRDLDRANAGGAGGASPGGGGPSGGADQTSACAQECSSPENATATCEADTCDFVCNSGYVRCDSESACCLAAATQIAAGSSHTCAIDSKGSVKCWGSNTFGELGSDPALASRAEPLEPTGVVRALSVSSGGSHSCALTNDGVACWGQVFGGAGSPIDGFTALPTLVDENLPPVASLTSGFLHSCVLLTDGTVRCWGSNSESQLGRGSESVAVAYTPAEVKDLGPGIRAVSAGDYHTCAITPESGVKCWGANDSGQLGDGTKARSAIPVSVVGLTSSVTAIAAGTAHTCATMDSGAIRCWGDNSWGELGDGTFNNSLVPVGVVGIDSTASSLAARSSKTCVVSDKGNPMCWGSFYLGDSTANWSAVPVGVSGLEDVVAIAIGMNHACALLGDRRAMCWGDNTTLQLGNESAGTSLIPIEVTGF